MENGTNLFQFVLFHLVNLLAFYVFLFCDLKKKINSLGYFSSPVSAIDFSFKLPFFLQYEIT